MFKKATISAIALSVAIISAQSTAQASVNPSTFDTMQTEKTINYVKLDIGQTPENIAAISFDAKPVLVAWSIKGAYKKAKKGVKKVGRATGRAVRKANRVVVPSEIRNGASFAYRKTKKGAKYAYRKTKKGAIYVYRNPYGKRCKPNKYLQPVCTVKGKRSR